MAPLLSAGRSEAFASLPAAEVERTVIEAAYMRVVARIFRREMPAIRLTELIKAICSFPFHCYGQDDH
ncbi:hypothetical protein [Bradyrhizobium sp. AS23.2]|uniref:hypothetical protein n=1 Tax=Bradyrhizobium sp. AS23.2 TaxID=1680155 RepID=UPI00116130E2|nr:hypothetical protein [Bradyrhizobium sp. AS23.2]